MKRVFALIAVALFATGAARKPTSTATAGRDWSKVVSRAADGAFVVGNPAARVKLIEYASYTCPHCAHFASEAEPELKDEMIRSGTVSLTFRHALREKLDLAAAVLARCTRSDFLGASDAIFAAQANWYTRGADFVNLNDERLSKYPEGAQLKAYADGAGLSDLMKARGLNDMRIAACFADPAELATLAKMADGAWATIKGTPTFVINGKQIDMADWAQLKAMLHTAGAK